MTRSPGGIGAVGAGASADVIAFLTRALNRTDAEVRIITIPAPAVPPEALLGDTATALFWTTPGAPVHVGLGATRTITAAGANRFDIVREAAERLWPGVVTAVHAEARAPTPRVFGGFAFLPGAPAGEWTSFGDATFILPRLLYSVDGDEASLSIAVGGAGAVRDGTAAVVAEVEALLARLGAVPTVSDPRRRSYEPARPPSAGDRDAWARSVASIQRRIEAGHAEKIVAARTRSIPLAGPADVAAILRRLALESATAARFAFRLGGDVFVGATPERLVGQNGMEVRTEALAGSIPADDPEREAHLLASVKEGVEHAYVVRAIVDALEPFCDRLEYPDEARVQRLRHVLHLQTPITGLLRRRAHVLELVERLHPTPAVGGWPTAEALDWIDREEPGSRGWYAAPVGWFDDRGDGEFGVALRSGLLHDGRAHLYAGAGIVRGSDAAAEYHETEIKLRTMMDALEVAS